MLAVTPLLRMNLSPSRFIRIFVMTNSNVVSLHSAAFFLERAREKSSTGDVTDLLNLFQQELEKEGDRPSAMPTPDEIAVILRRGKVSEARRCIDAYFFARDMKKRKQLLRRAEKFRKEAGASCREIGIRNERDYERMLRAL